MTADIDGSQRLAVLGRAQALHSDLLLSVGLHSRAEPLLARLGKVATTQAASKTVGDSLAYMSDVLSKQGRLRVKEGPVNWSRRAWTRVCWRNWETRFPCLHVL